MEKIRNQKITIHVSYEKEMTLCALEDSLHILNDAFATFSEETRIALSETNEISPKVVSVSNGSFVADVIVPISCTLLNILYDIIKRKFEASKEYKIDVYNPNGKISWTEEDTYQLSKRVVEEYVLGKGSMKIKDFIDTLFLSKKYPKQSIRAKIQNTKYLIENKRIQNNLTISPLERVTKMHRTQFNKACQDLSI